MSPAERPGGDRRNLTGKELVNVIAMVDLAKRKAHGGTGANRYTASTERPIGLSVPTGDGRRSRDEVAELVGTSPATVQRASVIYDDPEAMAEVEQACDNDTPPAGFDTQDNVTWVSNGVQDQARRDQPPIK